MDALPLHGAPTTATMKRKPVPSTHSSATALAPGSKGMSKVVPNAFLTGTIITALSLSWSARWIISGTPILVYLILLGEAYGHRILPFAPIWAICTAVNLVYAVCCTSWLLYWVFWACCWPAIFIVSLFQFNVPGRLVRRALRKTVLRELHFINDQIAFFNLPALEIDTEVKGLFVVRGVTFSLSTLTLIAHGVEAGIKLSDDVELAIQTDRVVVPLFREITVDDVYANVKGGEWEVTFGDVAYGTPEPDHDPSVIVTDTAILRAASIARQGSIKESPLQIVNDLTAGEIPAEAGDTKSAFAATKTLSPNESNAHEKYQELVCEIEETSAITVAKKALKEAAQLLKIPSGDEDGKQKEQKDGCLDTDNPEEMRAAICTKIHSGPSIPHPPTRSIRVSTLRKSSYPEINKFFRRFPFFYRLMLVPICYFHPVKFRSITAAGSGKWFVSLMRQYFFKHYSTSDAEIRRLESRISSWCGDADFAVELGEMNSSASFPLNTNYDIKCYFKVSDIMAYRALPDAVELKQVVRLGGGDATLTVPVFLFPHHEHIFPAKATEYEIMEMEQLIVEAEGTPKAVQIAQDLEKLKRDEASMHVSAHGHLPAFLHQDLLNFTAAIVKATKVIESDKDFEEAKVLRELKRISANADSEASSIASGASNSTDVTQTTLNNTTNNPDDRGFKGFLKKVDSGFKEAGNKTIVGMRKAGHSTVSAMANDRWIARLVGKATRKLENAQGEIGYSTQVPISLEKYRLKHEDGTKILP